MFFPLVSSSGCLQDLYLSLFSAVSTSGVGFWFLIFSYSLGTKEEGFYNAISILHVKLQVCVNSKPLISLFKTKNSYNTVSWHLFAGLGVFVFFLFLNQVTPFWFNS